MNSVHVARRTYGNLRVLSSNSNFHLNIGSFCSIGPDVTFVLADDHNMSNLSTYPFKAKLRNEPGESTSKGNIYVQDDVWIGTGAIILSGITIGQGSVIAAGAVVTADVKPYTIVGGIPAKIIGQRFSDNIIDKMKMMDFNTLSDNITDDELLLLYQNINEENIDKIICRFSKQ